MAEDRLQIEYVPIDSILPFEGNPRKMSQHGLQQLQRSLRTFSWTNPILVQKSTGIIIAGHQRLKAAKAEGLAEVPIIRLDMDDAKARAYNVADNATQEYSTWDEELLGSLLEDLRGEGIDLTITGLQESRIEEILGPVAPPGGVDDVPVVQPGATITRPGDLWILGKHRLLCGDSTKKEDVLRLMDGRKARLLSTDPPYCVDYTGADRPNGGKDWSEVFQENKIEDPIAFWEASLGLALSVCDDDAPVYCWHAHRRIIELLEVWRRLGLLCHQQIIWVKPQAAFGRSFWGWQHEPCLFGWREGHRPVHDGDMKGHTTVWRVAYQSDFDFSKDGHPTTDVWPLDWEGKQRPDGSLHATQKPVEVFAIPMRKHTMPGDVCYEPFSGSGSQIIAGELLGRSVYAMEITPLFVDVAVRRWEQLTGKTAQRVPADEVDEVRVPEAESAPAAEGAPKRRRRKKV